MRCPRCGEPLSEVVRDSRPPDILPDDCLIQDDKSEHWECLSEACDLRTPCYFVVHHPFRGIASAPGDSWSISWIK